MKQHRLIDGFYRLCLFTCKWLSFIIDVIVNDVVSSYWNLALRFVPGQFEVKTCGFGQSDAAVCCLLLASPAQADTLDVTCRNEALGERLCERKPFLCDWPGPTWWTCRDARLLMCTDVSPHIHKRVTAATGTPSPGARLRSLPLGPSTLHVALFDSDTSWKPGDVHGFNNVHALHQVFKSGTRLIIITTYILFISVLPRWFRVYLSSLPPSCPLS